MFDGRVMPIIGLRRLKEDCLFFERIWRKVFDRRVPSGCISSVPFPAAFYVNLETVPL